MCDCAIHLSRRRFGGILAGTLGAGLLPLRARAAGHVAAMGVTCIDYRLTDDATRFFDHQKLTNDYDQLSLAGASLAAVSPKFPSANAAFWDQLAIAKTLHNVSKLIVVDHRDCGAYKVAFGDKFAAARDAETAQHKNVMLQVKDLLAKKQPDIAGEFYLMALDGTTERVV